MCHRDDLFAADPRCHWCGTETLMGKGHGGKLATLDHVKSWPECSGKDEWAASENMVLACRSCNQRRSHEWCLRTTAPKKWAAYLAKQSAAGHTPLVSANIANDQAAKP